MKPQQGAAAAKLVRDECRAEANVAFQQHTAETQNLDVLSRCKKLNEFLTTDFLQGKGDQKAQLKEILGILHAGPKRPSFLDKPPVTATGAPKPKSQSPRQPQNVSPATQAQQLPCGSSAANRRPAAPEDVDDLISLLNDDLPPPDIVLTPSAAAAAATAAAAAKPSAPVTLQKAAAQPPKVAVAAPRAAAAAATSVPSSSTAVMQQQQQQAALAEEQRRKQLAQAEAARRERLRVGAAICIQKYWRRRQACKEASQLKRQAQVKLQHERRARELQRKRERAATAIQAAWRQCRQRAQYASVRAASVVLQTAVRAQQARHRLLLLQAADFRKHHAARTLQRAWRAWRVTRGHTLGPLRLPPAQRPSSPGVDSAALLAKQLRLRSAADTRLAPEGCAPGEALHPDDAAQAHRTVATHKDRVRQVSATERSKRDDVASRAAMAMSEHRDDGDAMLIARSGSGSHGCVGARPASAHGSAAELVTASSSSSSSGGQMGGGSKSSSRPGSSSGSALRPSSNSNNSKAGSGSGSAVAAAAAAGTPRRVSSSSASALTVQHAAAGTSPLQRPENSTRSNSSGMLSQPPRPASSRPPRQ